MSKKCELYKTKAKHYSSKVREEISKGCYTVAVYRYYFRKNTFKSEIVLKHFEMFYYFIFFLFPSIFNNFSEICLEI